MSAATGSDTDKKAPELQYGSAAEFMHEWLADAHRRDIAGNPDSQRWCPEWWRHLEAASVADALWRSWEAARQEPGSGMAYWWVHYAYPLMDRLLSIRGPFEHCRDGHNDATPKLPLATPPPGLFPDERGPRPLTAPEPSPSGDSAEESGEPTGAEESETEEEPFDVID